MKAKMQLGENLGNLLYEIACDKLLKGDLVGMYDTYCKGLDSFFYEYVDDIMRQNAVLVVSEDQKTMNLVNTPELIAKANHPKWDYIASNIIEETKAIANRFATYNKETNVYWFSLLDATDDYKDVTPEMANVSAAAIRLLLNDEDWNFSCGTSVSTAYTIWDNIYNNAANKTKGFERDVANVYNYLKDIRIAVEFVDTKLRCLKYLKEHDIINPKQLISCSFEEAYHLIMTEIHKFTNHEMNIKTHPMVDESYSNFDMWVYNKMYSNDDFYTMCYDEILTSDITLGYDAGWIDRGGDYYGINGDTGQLLHLMLADKLYHSNKYRQTTFYNTEDAMDADKAMIEDGWIKVHGNKVDAYKDITPAQLDALLKYGTECCNGNLYTSTFADKMVKVSDLRQMDIFAIRKAFNIKVY